LHCYHDNNNKFPAENEYYQGCSWSIKVLPYIEADNIYNLVWPSFQMAINADVAAWPYGLNSPTMQQMQLLYGTAANLVIADMTVPAFLCPSRRSSNPGPYIDYCGAYSGTYNGNGAYRTIFDPLTQGPKVPSIDIVIINNNAGTSNVLMLAHKSLSPSNYIGGLNNGNSQDRGYAWTPFTTVWANDMRWPDQPYVKDFNGVDENHFGG